MGFDCIHIKILKTEHAYYFVTNHYFTLKQLDFLQWILSSSMWIVKKSR